MKPPRVVLDTQTALVVAADLGAGGPSSEFFAAVERDADVLFVRHVLGARPWPPMRLVGESGARCRGSDVGSVGVSSWLPDPLSFIGRAANEGT